MEKIKRKEFIEEMEKFAKSKKMINISIGSSKFTGRLIGVEYSNGCEKFNLEIEKHKNSHIIHGERVCFIDIDAVKEFNKTEDIEKIIYFFKEKSFEIIK